MRRAEAARDAPSSTNRRSPLIEDRCPRLSVYMPGDMGSVDDLTVREVHEAESYKLSPEDYIGLVGKIEKRLRNRLLDETLAEAKKEATAELHSDIRAELRPALRIELEKELRPAIAKTVEAEIRPKIVAEVRADLKAKVHAEVVEECNRSLPTTKERARVEAYAHETEIECLTYASAAGKDADLAARALRWSFRIRAPLVCLLFASLPPFAIYLFQRLLLSMQLFAFLAPAVFIAIAYAVRVWISHARLKAEAATKLSLASAFSMLADETRRTRITTGNLTTSRVDLKHAVDSLTESKKSLNAKYYPEADRLERSRKEVRERILAETDTDKFLRIATTSPEEDEEPAAEEPKVTRPV